VSSSRVPHKEITTVEQVSQIKTLLDELARVVAEMEAMSETPVEEGVDAEPMTDEQEASLRSLEAKADKLKERISFVERIAAKELELRSVLERAAPAKVVAPEAKEIAVEKREFAVPKNHGSLRAFKDSETAYRAGMHVRGFVFGDEEARRWCRDHGVETRAQAGGINSLGGVLTSPEMSSEIIRLVEEYGVFPQYARRVSMNSDTLVIARRTGGLAARPVGENVEVTASDVTFDNVELNAKIWGVANRVPNSLLEDSVIDLADAMAVEIAQAYAEAFDNAGFAGDGTGSYHGVEGVATKILRSPYSKSVVTAPSGDNVFSELELKSFTDVVGRLPLFARRQAKWYVSAAGYGASMLRLAMAASGNNQADLASGTGLNWLGFPVVLVHSLTSDLTSTGGKVACLFGDLAQAATFGERRAVSIKTASERYVEYDQTLTFATTRNAMVVHDLGSTTVAGPIVALKFAA
jgi:HK97 family phage major capsid protein